MHVQGEGEEGGCQEDVCMWRGCVGVKPNPTICHPLLSVSRSRSVGGRTYPTRRLPLSQPPSPTCMRQLAPFKIDLTATTSRHPPPPAAPAVRP